MALPNTYLCTAPTDLKDTVGAEMLSDDIVRGLRQINANIVVPLPEHYEHYYPLKNAGITCLWLGRPGEGKKITAFKLGPVPEFTQTNSEGGLICKGWRAVFEKVVKAGAATALQIESKFNISLATDGNDKSCIVCRKQGKIKRAASTRTLLCKSCAIDAALDRARSNFKAKIMDMAKWARQPKKVMVDVKRESVAASATPGLIVPGFNIGKE